MKDGLGYGSQLGGPDGRTASATPVCEDRSAKKPPLRVCVLQNPNPEPGLQRKPGPWMERKNGRGPGEAKAGPRRALLYIKYTTPRTERGRKASISGAEAGSNKAPDELGGRARMGEARARPQRRPGKALDEKHLEKVLYVDGSGALSTTTFSTAITAITATTATNPPACSANLYIYIQNVLCWEGPWAGKEAVWGPDDTKPYCRKASIRHPAHSGGQGPDVLHGRGRMAEAKGRPQRRPGPGWAGRVDADGGGQGRPAAAARA
uniref:Uncharacterized protein n=1 Tax=Pyricularia oryzae (strain P131) TaxID=1143193 RepID=L7IS65_PYRO1